MLCAFLIVFSICRENFVRLDIYMQELRYEEITQQEAYSVIQLIGNNVDAM